CPPAQTLEQFLFGRLPEGEHRQVVEHVVSCPGCTKALSSLRTEDELGGTPRRENPAPRGGGPGLLAPPEGPRELGRLGGYRVLEVLGAGGMGAVFRAEDVVLHREVALKVLLPALAAEPESRERFLREARAAAAVEHEHVVRVLHAGEDRGLPF